MGYQQFFQGALVFSKKEAFERALQEIQSETQVSDHPWEREEFRKSMVGDELMLLNYDPYQPATSWYDTVSRLQILADHAARGLFLASIQGDSAEVSSVFSDYHPVPHQRSPKPIDPDDDYFPLYPGALYEFRKRLKSRSIHSKWWTPKEVARIDGDRYFQLVGEYAGNEADEMGMGEYYLSSGNRLYSLVAFFNQSFPVAQASHGLQLIADAQASPGTAWMQQSPGHAEMEVYRHQGFEDVETPFETFYHCLKLEKTHYFPKKRLRAYTLDDLEGGIFEQKTSHLYFAREVGLVKAVGPDAELVMTNFEPDAGIEPGVEPEVD